MTKSDLQIVQIDNLKDNWDDPDIRQLYADMMQIKFNGYGNIYGENVISSDKADFFGTHLIVCKKGLRLKPIFGYKSVTLDQCKEFNYSFPALSLVKSDAHEDCVTEMTQILEKCQNNKERISLDYSWAQDPAIIASRSAEFAQLLRDLVMVLVVNHHQDYKIKNMIACGVVKVKTDKMFEKMGMSKFKNKPLFPQKDLNGDEVNIYYTKSFSEYAQAVAKEHYDLWRARIIFKSKHNAQALIKNNAA